MSERDIRTDVLVIGCGIAGASAALEAAKAGLRVVVITKAPRAEESNTYYAQGGIVSFAPDDQPELLEEDILEAGDGIGDPAAVDILAEEARPRRRDPHRRAQDPLHPERARHARLRPRGRALAPPHPPRRGRDRPDDRGPVPRAP